MRCPGYTVMLEQRRHCKWVKGRHLLLQGEDWSPTEGKPLMGLMPRNHVLTLAQCPILCTASSCRMDAILGRLGFGPSGESTLSGLGRCLAWTPSPLGTQWDPLCVGTIHSASALPHRPQLRMCWVLARMCFGAGYADESPETFRSNNPPPLCCTRKQRAHLFWVGRQGWK